MINKIYAFLWRKEKFTMFNKSKAFIICWIFIVAVMVSSAFFIGYSVNGTRETSQSTEVVEEVMSLSDFNGHVALFKNNKENPDEVYDIYLSTLPLLDQKRLKAGIPLADNAELKMYLDDFDS